MLGWVIHGGDHITDDCLFTRELIDYEQLYRPDILGVEDHGESSQLNMHTEFAENISRKAYGRYEVNIPWVLQQNLQD